MSEGFYDPIVRDAVSQMDRLDRERHENKAQVFIDGDWYNLEYTVTRCPASRVRVIHDVQGYQHTAAPIVQIRLDRKPLVKLEWVVVEGGWQWLFVNRSKELIQHWDAIMLAVREAHPGSREFDFEFADHFVEVVRGYFK